MIVSSGKSPDTFRRLPTAKISLAKYTTFSPWMRPNPFDSVILKKILSDAVVSRDRANMHLYLIHTKVIAPWKLAGKFLYIMSICSRRLAVHEFQLSKSAHELVSLTLSWTPPRLLIESCQYQACSHLTSSQLLIMSISLSSQRSATLLTVEMSTPLLRLDTRKIYFKSY